MKKRIVPLVLSAAMLVSLATSCTNTAENTPSPSQSATPTPSASTGVEDGYIPAPYTVSSEDELTSKFLEPVFYENEDGPTIGVTLLGVIVQDGKYFRDLDNDQELDDFEDWRLDDQTRAEAMAAALTDEQLTHQVANNGSYSAKSTKTEDVVDENGEPVWTKLYPTSGGFGGGGKSEEEEDPDATNIEYLNSEGFRTLVIRNNPETEVAVWFNNGLEQYSEYDAITNGEVAVPFFTFTNPISHGLPNSEGVAAASLGAGNADAVLEDAQYDREVMWAKGVDGLYGPQIDLATDPRWSRNNSTYGEREDMSAEIASNLVIGYQNGDQGMVEGSVLVTVKHFPGDGAAYNGFESHGQTGRYRIYSTENSLADYQLKSFIAAFEAGAAGVMPGYSQPIIDERIAPQSITYNGETYVSRSNWEGTLMLWADENEDGENDNYVKLSMTDQMYQDTILDAADIPENDDQWPVMGSDETSYSLIQLLQNEDGSEIAYDDPMWEDLLNQLTYEDMSRLCAVGLRMTVSLESIGKPETLDHNGPSGVTQKYSAGANGYANQTNDPDKDQTGTCYPCNGILAATMNDQLVQEVGELIGEDAMWAGYAGFYGSGLNIHRTPYAGRVFEYYSEDGILTGLIDTYETIGIQSKGVYVYNKHFALNDQELQRQGLGTWCNEQAMREIYLRAFELPIVNADAKCVMTAFNRIGAVWSGACSELLTDWLRGEAGMTGFAVTDMYEGDYMSKPHEVLAGNDIPDNFPGTTGTGVDTASSGDLGFEFAAYGPDGSTPNAQVARALRESSHRILYTVLHSRDMDGIGANTRIVTVTPWWQTALNVTQIALAVLSVVAVVLLVADMVPSKKKKSNQ